MFHVEHFIEHAFYRFSINVPRGTFIYRDLNCSTWNIFRIIIKMFHVEHFTYPEDQHYKTNNKGYNGRFRKAEGKCQQLYKNKHPVEPTAYKLFHVEHFVSNHTIELYIVPRGTFVCFFCNCSTWNIFDLNISG